MNGRRHFLRHAGQAAVGLAALPLLTQTACATVPAVAAAMPSADDPAYWDRIRDLYPLTRERGYMNTGGLGPAPYPVLHAQQQLTMSLQTISEHGHSNLEPSRETVAAFLGADADEIAFARNATEGNSVVAAGLRLNRGDEVLFESHAHPGGAFCWMGRQLRDGIKVRIFEPMAETKAELLNRIESALTRKTKVLQVSHITAPTGIVMPVHELAELCKSRGIWFHIDGAQSAGMIPVDLHGIGCDSWATSGHKWMGGPHGTGALYVRKDRLDEVWPTEIGAYSDGGDVTLPDEFSYINSAVRFEPGTRDAPSVVGLAEAARFQTSIGPAKIAERGKSLAQSLQSQLRDIDGVDILTPSDPQLSASITTLRSERVPYSDLYRAYGEAKLRCRVVTERDLNAVRVSTHIFNSEAEVTRVVEATRAALAGS